MPAKRKTLGDSSRAEPSLRPSQLGSQWKPNQSFRFQNRLEDGGLDRIFKAVDATSKRKMDHSQILTDERRARLLVELVAAYDEFFLRSELDSTQSTREKTKSIKSTVKTARSLMNQLLVPGAGENHYSFAARVIAAGFVPPEGFKAFLAGLNQLIACAKTAQTRNGYLGYRSPRGLTDTFLSEILPKIYDEYFERKHGFTRGESGADGPYVRFAVAVMRETGREISPRAVIDAIRDKRSGKGASFRQR